MRSGRLRHRVTIEQRTLSNDAAGQSTETWATSISLKRLPARVEELSQTETIREREQVDANRSVRVTIRHNSKVKVDDRVIFEGRTFHIDGVKTDGLQHEMILMCNEG